jgi:glycosyltransferase involved in cell wall biosynthesis
VYVICLLVIGQKSQRFRLFMRILLLTDNFVPETNSPALRAYGHARRWIREGISVTIITSVPNFPTGRVLPPYRNWLYQTELLDGLKVIRVWTWLAPNRGIFFRSIDFLSFAVSSFVAGLFQSPDVIVATSPQLLTALSGSCLASVKRRPWVFEVRDLWPDSVVAVGAMRENLFIRLLRRLEHGLYRHATRVVAVSDGIRGRLIEKGVPSEKIGVAPNGVDLDRIAASGTGADAAGPSNFPGKFVAGYVGTHGMAQGLEVVLHAADRLRGSSVHFMFVGDGARRQDLMALAETLRLDNTTFFGLVPLATAAAHLRRCDVVLIPLKRTDQIEITLPGKIFEAAAMGKPLIVSAEGASAQLVQRYDAGLVVPPEDGAALADAIRRIEGDQALRIRLRTGALALARDFDRERFAADMLEQIRLAHDDTRG